MPIKKVATCDFCGFSEDLKGDSLPTGWRNAQVRIEAESVSNASCSKTFLCCPEHVTRLQYIIAEGTKLKDALMEGFKRG